MPSFDVVSEVDMHEVNNAIDQANREITTRFDLKSTGASVSMDKEVATILADADFQLEQVLDIYKAKLIKRGIDIACLELTDPEGAGKQVKQLATIKQGLDGTTSKKIVKLIKEKKMKVQSAIQGEKVRVTGKKRDDLQAVMALLREADIELPLQFDNFRD